MVPYIILTLIVVGYAFLDVTNLKNNRFLYFILFSFLVLFIGFRDNIGTDWWIYERLFLLKDVESIIEPGFNLIQIIVRRFFGHNVFSLIFCVAFVSVGIKFLAFNRLAPLWSTAVLFYFGSFGVNQDMNMIRQGLAVGVLLFSLPFLSSGKIKMFVFVVLISSLFHVSSLVFLVAPVFKKMKDLSLIGVLVVVLSASLFMFIDIVDFLRFLVSTVIVKVLPIPIIQEKLMFYITSRFAVANGFYLGSLFLLYYVILFGAYRKSINSDFYNVMYIVFVLGGVVLNFLFNSFEVLGRLTFHFQLIGAILYSYVVYAEKRMSLKFLYLVVLSVIMLIKVVSYVGSDNRRENFIPYKNVLQL